MKKTITTIGAVLVIILSVVWIFGDFDLIGGLFGTSDSTCIEAAEKGVKSQVYKELGVVADRFDSEVIYKDGNDRLIAVKYAFDDGDWGGAYCLYLVGEYVVNGTSMLPPGFDFDAQLEELKALFGL